MELSPSLWALGLFPAQTTLPQSHVTPIGKRLVPLGRVVLRVTPQSSRLVKGRAGLHDETPGIGTKLLQDAFPICGSWSPQCLSGSGFRYRVLSTLAANTICHFCEKYGLEPYNVYDAYASGGTSPRYDQEASRAIAKLSPPQSFDTLESFLLSSSRDRRLEINEKVVY